MVVIKVFMNQEAVNTGSKVYERAVPWSPSLEFPFKELKVTMRALYGSDCIIQIMLLP